MGIYNNNKLGLPEILKSKLCPFCNNSITEKNLPEYSDSDSFEFMCIDCNPQLVISLSGGLVVSLDHLMENNDRRFAWMRESIKGSKNKIFKINESDLR